MKHLFCKFYTGIHRSVRDRNPCQHEKNLSTLLAEKLLGRNEWKVKDEKVNPFLLEWSDYTQTR
jgi:hypothetical protein